MRGLSTEGNLCFKINRASPIDGSKFTVFALFYFVFEGNFPSTSPRGAYIWRGDLTEGFFRYRFGGLIHGGAYFRNFTVYYQPRTQACSRYPSDQRRLGTQRDSDSDSDSVLGEFSRQA